MKKAIIAVSILSGLAICAYGQGTLGPDGSFSPNGSANGSFTIDNTANNNMLETATSGGLVWIGNTFNTAALLNQDVNIAVYDAGTLVVTLLEEPGDTGPGNGDGTAFGGGQFYDNSGTTYYDTHTAGGGTASLTLDMWTGDYATYAAAVASDLSSVYAGTVSFTEALGNAFGTPANSTAVDFTSMPALVMLPVASVPEPTVLALATVGGISLLALRRRKSA